MSLLEAFLSVAASGDLKALSVIHIITATVSVGTLMDYNSVVAEEVSEFSTPDLDRLKAAKLQFEQYKTLRNLLAHQPATFSPYTEVPFAIQKQSNERKVKDF